MYQSPQLSKFFTAFNYIMEILKGRGTIFSSFASSNNSRHCTQPSRGDNLAELEAPRFVRVTRSFISLWYGSICFALSPERRESHESFSSSTPDPRPPYSLGKDSRSLRSDRENAVPSGSPRGPRPRNDERLFWRVRCRSSITALHGNTLSP